MKDTFNDFNIQDFSKNYLECFGEYSVNGVPRVVFISSVEGGKVNFNDGGGFDFHVLRNSGIFFDFIPLAKGFYNTQNHVYYVERLCERQYKKGICSSNTQLFLLKDLFTSTDITCGNLSAIKYGVSQKKNGGAYAISRHFAVSSTGDVYCFKQSIGVANDNKIVLFDDTFKQELEDQIKRNNLEITVSV